MTVHVAARLAANGRIARACPLHDDPVATPATAATWDTHLRLLLVADRER